MRVIRRHDGLWVAACPSCRVVVGHQDDQAAAMAAARTHAWLHVAQDAVGAMAPPPPDPRVDLASAAIAAALDGLGVARAAERFGMTADSLRRRLLRRGLHVPLHHLTANDRRAA
jgi:DNA-binding transcriptional LysR family regulator